MCCTILNICTAHLGGYPLSLRTGNTGGGGVGERGGYAPSAPPPFCLAKRKKGNKKKKSLLKSLLSLLKVCHQGQNVTVLAILERLKFKTFSCCAI